MENTLLSGRQTEACPWPTKKKNPLKHKSDWSPATLKTSTRRMSSFSDCLHSCCLWSQYCKTTLNCTGISKRMLRTGMAAPGAGQDLGVLTELGHPCSRCATEIQAWSCCTPVPGLTVGLRAISAEGSAGEPSPSQKAISAEMVKFHGRIMHREEKKKKKVYRRTQSTAALKNDSYEGVGQTEGDAQVCVCPSTEVGSRTGLTTDWHQTNTSGLFLPPVCNSAGTSVPLCSLLLLTFLSALLLAGVNSGQALPTGKGAMMPLKHL